MDTRIKFSIRLPPEAVAVLDAMAEKNHRPRNNMTEFLLLQILGEEKPAEERCAGLAAEA